MAWGPAEKAIDAASQQLKGLDTVWTRWVFLATRREDARGEAAHDATCGSRSASRRRNSYRLLETRFLDFERDQAEIRNQDITELEEVAKVLKADVNAVLELQGFAICGSDPYNYQLARERVETQ